MFLRMRDEAPSKDARETPESLIAAAKIRLKLWNVTDAQIAELEKTRKPAEYLILRSPFRGVVQEVPAHQGVNVKAGDHLVDVADLFQRVGMGGFLRGRILHAAKGVQKVVVTTQSYPGEKFNGEITVINPFLDEAKRTARKCGSTSRTPISNSSPRCM